MKTTTTATARSDGGTEHEAYRWRLRTTEALADFVDTMPDEPNGPPLPACVVIAFAVEPLPPRPRPAPPRWTVRRLILAPVMVAFVVLWCAVVVAGEVVGRVARAGVRGAKR